MKILIIGAGLSGCSMARLLKNKGHDVSLIEKEDHVGGLCITKTTEDGMKYEPFGARTFHTNNPRIKEFITQFDDFNGYVHRKGMVINNRLFPFPISIKAIANFKEKNQIIQELKNRPKTIDKTNFETVAISIFGKTLYSYFIENYTLKMWGIDPKNLTADWAYMRLELRGNGQNELFQRQWQGLPKKGYSLLLQKMIEGIPIALNTTSYNPNEYDVVVSSQPIDQAMNFKFGKLQYRGMKFDYQEDEPWEKDNYGTINLPQHPAYIRKCNFKILHKQESERNWIQYQEPVAADEKNVPMYPINTKETNNLFDRYLKEVCMTKNICPIGRLGLFKYLDMDKAVEVAFDSVKLIENYLKMDLSERYGKIKDIREKY